MQFNPEQEKIINSIKGAFLVSAPVGTGKTTVLTERVIKALDAGIKPEEILCLTFTNRAAEEMSERIKKRVANKAISDQLTIKTFHGFCAYFIKAEAKEIGLPVDFSIFDETDQLELLRKIINNYPELDYLTQGKNDLPELARKIYDQRLNQAELSIGCKVRSFKLDEIEQKISQEYFSGLMEQNALDFNELVVLTLKTLGNNKKIQVKWASRYKFIQLDEFQDTHLSEYLVVKELAKIHGNLAFIGDLDQTIYGWRGSEPFFIKELFKKHFAPVIDLHLEINYRFNNSILEAVKSFLTSLEKSNTKKLTAFKNVSPLADIPIKLFAAHNLTDEIGWTVEQIEKIKQTEPDAKIAVLTRYNSLINKVAGVFEKKNIAHITVDKYQFFKRQEIKDILAYLKLIFNRFELESAYRAVTRPSRNIGPATLKAIREAGNEVALKISDFLNFNNYNFSEPFDNLIERHQKGRIIVLDTETTGTNVTSDEIIQIYALEIINGQPGTDFHFYLKNTIPVGFSGTVHGISDEFLAAKGYEPKEVLEKLKVFINNDIVVGHNINFDLSMIRENGRRLGIEFNFAGAYDTLDLSRRLIESEDYKLTTLARLLNLATATHDAKDDVLATAGLLSVLVDKLRAGQAERQKMFQQYNNKFIKLASLLSDWQKLVKVRRPTEALAEIWESSGLKEYYSHDEVKDRRLKSIETLTELFKDKDEVERPADIVLRELLQTAALVRDLDFLGLDQGKIPIVTVHQVKGLEFDYVFMIGLNEGQFPLKFKSSDLEEEKRLFYVALTRARQNIFLSYSRFGDYDNALAPSSFIGCIDRKYVEKV